MKRALKFSNSGLIVRDIHGNVAKLGEFDRAYIVGAGKASTGHGLCGLHCLG